MLKSPPLSSLPQPIPPVIGNQSRGLLLSIAIPIFLAVVDQTIVVAALPAIAQSLGNADKIAWIVVSYLMAATIAAPVYGRMGDSVGRRRLLFIALLVFISGSFACAITPSMEVLIFGRVLQGLGGGGLIALSQALIGEAIPPRERARFQGYFAMVAITANSLGPVIGGYLADFASWRSIFYMNIPLGILAFLLAFRLQDHRGTGNRGRFDFPSLFLLVVFVTSTLTALRQIQEPDTSRIGLAALGLLSVASASLFFRQMARSANPLLPIKMVRNASIWRSDVMAACHGAAVVSLLTFIPLYLRTVHGLSASEIGTVLMPMTIGLGLGSFITGRLMSATGWTALFPSIGLPMTFIFLVLLGALASNLSVIQVSILLSLVAVFMGTVMAVVDVTVQVAAGAENLGSGAATVQLARSLGAGIGTAIVSIVLFTVLRHSPETAQAFVAMLEDGSRSIGSSGNMLKREIAGAFSAAFLTTAGFAGVSMILAWSLPLRRI